MILENNEGSILHRLTEDIGFKNKTERHFYAFSSQTRNSIMIRACYKSEVSGSGSGIGWDLEASHINHDRSNTLYDNPSMGIMMTTAEHCIYHLMFKDAPHLIGMNTHTNNFAIESLAKRSQIGKLTQAQILEIELNIKRRVYTHCDLYGVTNPFEVYMSKFLEK